MSPQRHPSGGPGHTRKPKAAHARTLTRADVVQTNRVGRGKGEQYTAVRTVRELCDAGYRWDPATLEAHGLTVGVVDGQPCITAELTPAEVALHKAREARASNHKGV